MTDWTTTMGVKVVTCQEYYISKGLFSYTIIAKLDGKVYACSSYPTYQQAKAMLLQYRSNNSFYKFNILQYDRSTGEQVIDWNSIAV